jgi:hypothetical protein
MYVNFHTAAHPGGEMRGQLNLATAVMFRVDLDGTQEAPPVGTSANGTGRVILKPGFSELDYEFAYQGLSGPLSAGGHFHFGALGEPGPVVKTIAFSGDSSSNIVQGEWKATDPSGPLTSAVIDSLIAGKLYVNFHTTAHPGGEIRGQLKMAGGTAFGAMLQGSNEVPANASDGKGVGYFILNGLRTELRYAVTYFKLTGPLTAGGHFHVGGNGKNGPVVKGIATGGMAASATVSGTWSTTDATNPLTPALVESLFTKRVYVNFHTAANPGGEIRSQLDLLSGYGFTVLLDGAQEVPPSGSAAQGSGSVVLSPGADSVQYSVTYYGLSGTLTAGGHFHIGSPGKLGPVVKSIAFLGGAASSTYQGTWSPFDATQPLNNHYF